MKNVLYDSLQLNYSLVFVQNEGSFLRTCSNCFVCCVKKTKNWQWFFYMYHFFRGGRHVLKMDVRPSTTTLVLILSIPTPRLLFCQSSICIRCLDNFDGARQDSE